MREYDRIISNKGDNMPTIAEAITRLNKVIVDFSDYKNFPDAKLTSSILTALNYIQELSYDEDYTTEIVERLRTSLNYILDQLFIFDETDDAIYFAMLALAELQPINTIDPITQESINEIKDSDDKVYLVYLSIGKVFHINALIEWYMHDTQNAFKDPSTRASLNSRDQITIVSHPMLKPGTILLPIQSEAIELFNAQGLTVEHLQDKYWFNHPYHINAIRTLINVFRIPVEDALLTIERFTPQQALLISRGFSKNEILSLPRLDHKCHDSRGFNAAQITALNQLKSHGLKEIHLQQKDWFNSIYHFWALSILLTRKLSVDEAMSEISELSTDDLPMIIAGLTRNEILIKNKHIFVKDIHLMALVRFAANGLVASHLEGKNWFNSVYHVDALSYLLVTCKLTIATALAAIENLPPEEAKLISYGFTSGEISKLSTLNLIELKPFKFNKTQLIALSNLNSYQLLANHLQRQDWFNDVSHFRALSYLFVTKKLSPNAAMAQLDGFNPEQAKLIIQGFTRDEILELSKVNKDELTSFQLQTAHLIALGKFKSHGLLPGHLQEKDWFNSAYHVQALARLIEIGKLSLSAAMIIIDHLSPDEAEYITRLTRHEIATLKTNMQLLTLGRFKGLGMTVKHLQGKEQWLNFYHFKALGELLEARQMLVDDAMAVIHQLNQTQAKGIFLGLTREEVLPLNNIQIEALIVFKPYGITAEHLRNKSWFNHIDHIEALKELIVNSQMSSNDAMNEIDQFTREEAQLIIAGYSRTEILGLTLLNRSELKSFDLNITHLIALTKFTSYGITPANLQGKDWFNDLDHIRALSYLLENTEFSLVDALKEIELLNKYQAKGIAHGLSKKDVLVLSSIHINAVITFKKSGITPKHLTNKDWFNDDSYIAALHYLFDVHKKSADDAINEIDQLNPEQIKLIREGYTRTQILALSTLDKDNLKRFTLLTAHLVTLSQLQEYDLEPIMLEGRFWFNDVAHVQALSYLLITCKFSLDSAMEKLDSLNADQAKLIVRGFSRDEILGLSALDMEELRSFKLQSVQLIALSQLKLKRQNDFYKYEIKPHHLQGKDWFNSVYHVRVLVALMAEYFIPESALAVIEELNEDQLRLMTKFNGDQLVCFGKLKKFGLTVEHLQGKDQWFGCWHRAALETLVEIETMPIDMAIAEIDQLNDCQSEGISNGLSRAEVLPLTETQIEILTIFKSKGITVQHLQGKNWLTFVHSLALSRLLKLQPPMSADNAMAEIDKLTPEQARRIFNGETRKKIFDPNTKISKNAFRFLPPVQNQIGSKLSNESYQEQEKVLLQTTITLIKTFLEKPQTTSITLSILRNDLKASLSGYNTLTGLQTLPDSIAKIYQAINSDQSISNLKISLQAWVTENESQAESELEIRI